MLRFFLTLIITIYFTTNLIPQNSFTIDINKLKMPLDNTGYLGDYGVSPSHIITYDNIGLIFSAGSSISFLVNDTIYANGVFSSDIIYGYQPGIVGGNPIAPKNKLYILKSTDSAFGDSWQDWIDAVSLGAKFYDGNSNGVYEPVDLNNNGEWDLNEDRPDLLGDISIWCVYNDGLADTLTRFGCSPAGFEIRQTLFASSELTAGIMENVIFIRYIIENKGTVSDKLKSVYFSFIADPDIGAYNDDLVGCDTILQAGYAYNSAEDDDYGVNPPAVMIDLLQGPHQYLPDITYIDINSNGIYDSGIDTPIDSAKYSHGPYLGAEIIPGARNQSMSSFTAFFKSHPRFRGPSTKEQMRNLMLGGTDLQGDSLYVSNFDWGNGAVLGNDTANIPSHFMFSGNPVTGTGWLNVVETDVRFMLTTGPFDLYVNEPVEILGAYVVGRGFSSLSSVSVMKDIDSYVQEVYDNNFEDLPTGIADENNLIVEYFRLSQNYPNPFNPVTKIKFTISTSPLTPSPYKEEGNRERLVTLKVYDILGNEVAVLVNEQKSPGKYEIEFDGSKLPSGVYFYRLSAGNFSDVKKMLLIK